MTSHAWSMLPSSRLRWIVVTVLASALVAGCATDAPVVRPKLPLHLALKPIAEPVAERVTLASKPPTEAEKAEVFRVRLGRELLQRRLSQVLSAECFERVTVLEPPAPDSGSATWTPEQWDQHWVEQTKRCDADVFLECSAVYDEHVALGWTSGGAYTDNWLYFLLGGPVCYTINDRSYRAPAVLEGTYYDLAQVHGRGASLDDPRVAILDTSSIFEWIDYDFIDRNDSGAWPYVQSLVIPTGFLQLETDKARKKMEEDVVEKLAVDFSHRTYDQRETILRAGRRTGFTLDPRWHLPEFVAYHGGGWDLKLELRLWPGQGIQKLREAKVRVEGRELSTTQLDNPVEEKTGRGRTLEYALAVQGEDVLPEHLTHVRVEVSDASADRNTRTFTLPVHWTVKGN